MSNNIVNQYPAIEATLVTELINALNSLSLCEEEPVLLYPGTAHYNRYWRSYPAEMETFCALADRVNPFEYNAIYISKNYEREKGVDHKRYGPQLTISLGDFEGNRLIIADDYVDDHNTPTVFDGTLIPYETDPQLSGTCYRLLFFKI
jgi:hypothetical protein